MFKTLLEESNYNEEQLNALEERLTKAANTIREHEHLICEKVFAKGGMDGITELQLKHFGDSRLNLCFRNFGFKNLYEVKYNPVADWFYRGINSYKLHDLFTRTGSDYNRNWNEEDFAW